MTRPDAASICTVRNSDRNARSAVFAPRVPLSIERPHEREAPANGEGVPAHGELAETLHDALHER